MMLWAGEGILPKVGSYYLGWAFYLRWAQSGLLYLGWASSCSEVGLLKCSSKLSRTVVTF